MVRKMGSHLFSSVRIPTKIVVLLIKYWFLYIVDFNLQHIVYGVLFLSCYIQCFY